MNTSKAQFEYNILPITLTTNDILKRAMKYLIEGLAVAFVAYLVAKDSLTTRQILIIALTAAITFALLDFISPTISYSVNLTAPTVDSAVTS